MHLEHRGGGPPAEALGRRAVEIVEHADEAMVLFETVAPGEIAVIYANRRFCEWFGFDPDAVLGAPAEAMIEHLLDTTAVDRIAEAVASASTFRGDLQVELADGSCGWVEATLIPVGRRADGFPERLVLFERDISTQKATEQQLEARALDILESMGQGYVAVDGDWRITYLNPVAARLLGPIDQMLRRDLWEAFPGLEESDFGATYRAVADDREARRTQSYFEPHDRWYEVGAYPLDDGLCIYIDDITSRWEDEQWRQGLLEAERRARQAAEDARRELLHRATHDALTGLPNREALLEHLDAIVDRPGEAGATLLFVDLDRFKIVNDSFGHSAGDDVLVATAERITAAVRPGDLVARLGGDEFVVSLPGTDLTDAEAIAERILAALREPLSVSGHPMVLSASIGLCAATPGTSGAALLRDADVALYRAKDRGGDQLARFDPRNRRRLLQKVEVEADLRRAIEDDHLRLEYQPAFDLLTGEVQGVEALLRWDHPTHGPISPAHFVPVAEESGLIVPLGEWVASTACAEVGALPSSVRTWVNVSVRQLVRSGFAAVLERCLGAHGLSPASFGIEVTESTFSEPGRVRAELERIAELGIAIALDDFGTGYSSLARLRLQPVDLVKIDRSFTVAATDPGGAAVVAAIVELGHALGTRVIAEGVDDPRVLDALVRAGCDEASGFLLGRPVPVGELRLDPHPLLAGAAERRRSRPDRP